MQDRGFPRLFEDDTLADMGAAALKLISDTETYEGIFGGKQIWWNVYASTILLVIFLTFFKITPGSSVVSLVVIARSLVVFLAAPAGFTIYYTTLFIGAPLIFLLFLCEAMQKWRKVDLVR